MARRNTDDLVLDIYARVSREDDDRQRSTEGQVDDCKARVAEQGAQVGEIHIDSGRSAWNPRVKRPDWDRLMERLESGATGGVVVFDLERFSRRPIEGERLITAAERGLVVLDSEDEYDLTTASGKKAFRDALSAAAYYSDRLSTRVARGKRLKAMKGESNATWRGFGFAGTDLRTGETVPADQVAMEVDVLRECTDRLLAGEAQDVMIAELNDRGVKTSTGGHWTRRGFRQVLTRAANAGLIIYRGEVVGRLSGEPLIEHDKWEAVRALFDSRRRGRPNSATYLCSGLIWCGRCRAFRLTGRPRTHLKPYPDGEVRRQYWCQRRPGQPYSGCGRLSADQRAVDVHVKELTLTILSDPRHAANIAKAAGRTAGDREKLDAQIFEIEQTQIEFAARLGRGEIDLARHDAAVDPLDRRLASLRGKRDALELAQTDAPLSQEETAASRAEWEQLWESVSVEERRKFVRRALRGRRLYLMPYDRHAPRTFDPNRLVLEDENGT